MTIKLKNYKQASLYGDLKIETILNDAIATVAEKYGESQSINAIYHFLTERSWEGFIDINHNLKNLTYDQIYTNYIY